MDERRKLESGNTYRSCISALSWHMYIDGERKKKAGQIGKYQSEGSSECSLVCSMCPKDALKSLGKVAGRKSGMKEVCTARNSAL